MHARRWFGHCSRRSRELSRVIETLLLPPRFRRLSPPTRKPRARPTQHRERDRRNAPRVPNDVDLGDPVAQSRVVVHVPEEVQPGREFANFRDVIGVLLDPLDEAVPARFPRLVVVPGPLDPAQFVRRKSLAVNRDRVTDRPCHGAVVEDPPPQQIRTANSFRSRSQESDRIETGNAGNELQPARPVAEQNREESVPGC